MTSTVATVPPPGSRAPTPATATIAANPTAGSSQHQVSRPANTRIARPTRREAAQMSAAAAYVPNIRPGKLCQPAMQCPSCGNENREEAKFCDSCGARLEAPEPVAPAEAPPASDGAPEVVAGRFAIRRFLGRGARKEVYLA